MKKVLVFGFTNLIGGIENYYMSFYRIIKDMGYQIDFVCNMSVMAFEDEVKMNGSTIYYAPNIKSKPLAYYRYVNKILKKNKYDIVHANMLSAANIMNLILAKRNNVKTIIAHSHCTGVSGSKIKLLLHKVNKRRISNLANVFLSCSDKASSWLFSDDVTATIVNNALKINRFAFKQQFRTDIRGKYGIKENEYLVGHVGRFSEAKNQKFIVDLANNIVDENIKFMLIGNGEDKNKIKYMIEQYGLNKKIIIVDEIQDVYKYYSAFDIFIFPSKFEGLGIVAVEAQISGLRCIFSENIVKDVNLLNDNFYLSLSDLHSWVKKISEKRCYDRIVDNNIFVKKGFSIDNEVEKIIKIYSGENNEKINNYNSSYL